MSRIGAYSAIGYPVDGGYQSITTSGTSAATSSGVGAHTHRVVLEATADAHIVFAGSGGAATTSDFLLSSNAGPVMFVIRPGQYVHAIQSSAAGTVHVSEVDA